MNAAKKLSWLWVFITSIASITAFTGISCYAGQTTFVETCLGSTHILESTLRCEVQGDDNTGESIDPNYSTIQFDITKGTAVHVKGSGSFGSYSNQLPVKKIQHLPSRITDLGMQEESVRFLAYANNRIATIAIPCNQTDYAIVGIANMNGNILPVEYMASCKLATALASNQPPY